MVYLRTHFLETHIKSVLVFGLFITKYKFNYTKKKMNMAFIKNDNVLTVVIIFIIIIVRNSTANGKYN